MDEENVVISKTQYNQLERDSTRYNIIASKLNNNIINKLCSSKVYVIGSYNVRTTRFESDYIDTEDIVISTGTKGD